MSAATRLKDRVLQFIVEQALWAPDERVAVAVSGGLDSVVLLDVLVRTQRAHGGHLSVVTIDHGTRPGSAQDTAFVLDLASSHGLPAQTQRFELGAAASEQACRDARYGVFDTLNVHHVALAHHRDDQAETVLMRWVRGAGTGGLSGMAARRGRYVRPFLDEPQQAVRAYAEAMQLTWREDPSNTDPRFLRNRVRAELLPLMESLRPGASTALARSARLAAADDALLCELASKQCPHVVGGWYTRDLASAPEPIARRALNLALPLCSSAHIDAILGACRRGHGVVALSATVQVRIDRELVSITAPG
ncbi:MAG: tRNA lysidine(34) synthetase TilS [Myxococcota bacterium]